MGGEGVKGRLEVFRKFIRFGSLTLSLNCVILIVGGRKDDQININRMKDCTYYVQINCFVSLTMGIAVNITKANDVTKAG